MSDRPRTDEGPLFGAAAGLMLYGLVVVLSGLFDVSLVPEKGFVIGVLMVAILVVGAGVGTLADSVARRR